MKTRITFLLLTIGMLLGGLLLADSNDRYVRLRYVTGEVTLIPSDNQRPNDATLNTPILDGDELQTGNGRAELAFSNGVVVRVGDYSDLRVDSSYSPMSMQLLNGTIFVDSGLVGSLRDQLEIVSGDAQIFMINEGNLRIDHGNQGSIRITSLAGEAEVRGAGRRVLLEAGERTYVDPGAAPEQPQTFAGNYDELDDWNDSRRQVYAQDQGPYQDRYVDRGIYYDSYDLNNYGDWQNYQDYGYVWVPNVDAGWRPYYDGRWSYLNGSWFWISAEPWGWAPYHYGRWGWDPAFGWYWLPGAIFSSAWVSWYDYGSYVGWCPLNYWNQPVYGYNNLPTVQKQKTDLVNSWTFIKKDQIGSSNVKRLSASVNEIKNIQIDPTKVKTTPGSQLVSLMPKTERRNPIHDVFTQPKSQPNSNWVKEHQEDSKPGTTAHKDPGFDKNKIPTGKIPTGKDPVATKQQPPASHDWEQDRNHPPSKNPVKNLPPNGKQQNYNRDQQFERYNPSNRSKNDMYFPPPWVNQNDPGDVPWFRNPRYYDQNDPRNGNGGGREVTPRYSEDVKKMFERFDRNNPAPPSSRSGSGNSGNSGNSGDSHGSSGGSHNSGSGSKPSGGKPSSPPSHGGQVKPPPKPH